jgi:hypothetical protein
MDSIYASADCNISGLAVAERVRRGKGKGTVRYSKIGGG